MVDTITPTFPLTADPAYRSGAGHDIGRRLADVRNENPELVSLHPERTTRVGDRFADRSIHLVAATVLVAGAFSVRWRRPSPDGAGRSWPGHGPARRRAGGRRRGRGGGLMAMDLEVVHKAAGTTRFEKAPALLVGLAAVVASLLGTLEVSANKRQEQAQAVAVRLTVQAFGTLAGSAPRPPPGRHTRRPCPTPTWGGR